MQTLLEQLADRFVYDNGVLIKKSNNKPCTLTNNRGYIRVSWDRGTSGRVREYAHRLVWFKHFGSIPEGMMIDHINGVKTDNRIENLRLICKSGNAQNSHWKGCWLVKRTGKYAAAIKLNGKTKHLGVFASEAEAREAYLTAKRELHPYASEHVLT